MPKPKIKPSLESRIGQWLKKHKKTLATAESCTGGLIAHLITNVPGASRYFLCGVVSYSNQAKIKILGVRRATMARHGAVSPECAVEMARGIRRLTQSDYAIAVTGIAGPGGGTKTKPVGTVHIALAGRKEVIEELYFFPYDREKFKELVAVEAFKMLTEALLKEKI